MPNEEERALTRGHLKFVGGRFEGDGIHLEGLSELVRYQRLVLEFAKDIWREQHSTSMPTAIQKMFELRMTESEDGSFEATLVREDSALSPDVEEIAELTDERVNTLFERLTRGATPDIAMSPESVVAVKKFGLSFQPGEGLAIFPNTQSQRLYDQPRRKWLKQLLKPETMNLTGTALVGKVFALDTNVKSFKLELPDGSDVLGKYNTEFNWEDFRPVIDLPDSRTLIRLVCSYTARLTGEPIKIDDVEAVEVFSHEDDLWTANLTELAALRRGWYRDGVGQRIDISAIEYARDILRAVPVDSVPRPQAYPTVEGGVQIEWLSPTSHTELSISPDLVVEAHHYDAESESSRSGEPVGPVAALDFLRGVGRVS